MITVNKLIPGARGLASVLIKRASQVELDWDVRQKSRFDTKDSAGRALGVFLPRGSAVRGGDVLVAEDGSLIKVKAAAQPVLVVRPCSEHGSAFDLVRAAYHLGNRHVALELKPDHLKLEPDHVLADMLRAMHLIVTEENSAFEPEAGAYAGGGHAHAGHAHDGNESHAPAAHAHEGHAHEGHAHDHAHKGHAHKDDAHHGHGHAKHAAHHAATAPRAKATIPIAAAPAKPHVHGPGCGHDHGDSDHHH